MALIGWIALVTAGLAAIAFFYLGRRRKQPAGKVAMVQAKQQFHVQRERLEAKFIQLAAAHVGPDAPQLADCSFDDDVAYVRSRSTGQLSAFVAVTIATTEGFEPVSQQGVNLVENLQAGTAVFRFDRDHWETDGRAILNLTPNEAAQRFGRDLELVEQEIARRR